MARRRAQSPAQSGAQDTARTESQQMLALSHFLKKPKGDDREAQQFRAKVVVDQKQLKALLEQRVRRAEQEDMSRREEIAATILKGLKTPNRPMQGEIPTFAGTDIAGNAVYASITNVLTTSEGLVAEYERLDGMIADLRKEEAEPFAETWKQDVEHAQRQLDMGARVARRNVKKVLGAEIEDDELRVADGKGDKDMDAGSEEMELNYELQKSLRYAERGVKRMVKGLPSDEAY